MKYVFFDIECACVYKDVAKICVFGYCVCDENFNILGKEDILINPNGKFHLTAHGGDGIVLPYNYADFKKYPDFSAFYSKIKELLEGKDKIVVGHAAVNDVKYLNLETKRYKLPSFRFEFADTQVLYMAMCNAFDRQPGLDKLTERFHIEFQAHCAADDAYATLRVAQAMCIEEDCTFPELLQKHQIKFGKIRDYEYTNCTSRAATEYFKRRAEEKEKRESVRAEFNSFVCCTRMRPQIRVLGGKKFNFSKQIEENLQISKPLVREICRRGGRYTLKLSLANVYVAEEDDMSVRTVSARRASEEGKPLEMITLAELYRLLEMKE